MHLLNFDISVIGIHGSNASSGGSPGPGRSPINSILSPTPAEDLTSSTNASHLQRMASITNSLISQPTPPPMNSQSQRPLKAVLPAITQQHFDLYDSMNTEDIVR